MMIVIKIGQEYRTLYMKTNNHFWFLSLDSSWKEKRCRQITFIVAPCNWMSSKSFIYQQTHSISVLENIKIYIKIHIKIAPTSFGLRPSSGSLHMSLAKVTFIKSVKVRRYGLCGCVAASKGPASRSRW
jgi:hypothetical protein